MDFDNPTVVAGNGFYSQKNLLRFQRRGRQFLTLVDTCVAWMRNALESVRERLDDGDAICPFDPETCGVTLALENHVYEPENKKTGASATAGGLPNPSPSPATASSSASSD